MDTTGVDADLLAVRDELFARGVLAHHPTEHRLGTEHCHLARHVGRTAQAEMHIDHADHGNRGFR